jgi:nucleoside 2-deoxyribosyltransferase
VSKIYLASPYGFTQSTKEFLREIKLKLAQRQHEVMDPWELGEPLFKIFERRSRGLGPKRRIRERQEFNRQIGELNRRTIESVEVVVAALDGPDVDSGTASEVGFAFANGKTIFGYRNDLRRTGEDGAIVNLQVQYWIEESGGQIVKSIPNLLDALGAVRGDYAMRKRVSTRRATRWASRTARRSPR